MLEPNKDLEEIFENAVSIAAVNNHEYVTLEHFLYSMLKNKNFTSILNSFGADVKVLKESLENFINTGLSDIVNNEITKPKKTSSIDRVLNRAFTEVLFSGRQIIEPVDCFVSILSEKNSHACFFANKAKINKEKFVSFIQKDTETQSKDTTSTKTNAILEKVIEQYCDNLTERAKNKKIDPVIGREKEIEEIQLVLARKSKSNAILIGDPGVGKPCAGASAKRTLRGITVSYNFLPK